MSITLSCSVSEVNNKVHDPHAANSFKEALDLMSSSKQDFMIFPMDPSLFGFDVKIDLSSYASEPIGDMMKVIFINIYKI